VLAARFARSGAGEFDALERRMPGEQPDCHLDQGVRRVIVAVPRPALMTAPSAESDTFASMSGTTGRRLYLLRHAESSWKQAELADHERPLAGRGRRAAKAMARHLKQRGIAPD
jgi:hypothetical protein